LFLLPVLAEEGTRRTALLAHAFLNAMLAERARVTHFATMSIDLVFANARPLALYTVAATLAVLAQLRTVALRAKPLHGFAVGTHRSSTAGLTLAALLPVFANRRPATLLALRPHTSVFANRCASTIAARVTLTTMFAEILGVGAGATRVRTLAVLAKLVRRARRAAVPLLAVFALGADFHRLGTRRADLCIHLATLMCFQESHFDVFPRKPHAFILCSAPRMLPSEHS
jgi:hypothetical protein